MEHSEIFHRFSKMDSKTFTKERHKMRRRVRNYPPRIQAEVFSAIHKAEIKKIGKNVENRCAMNLSKKIIFHSVTKINQQ